MLACVDCLAEKTLVMQCQRTVLTSTSFCGGYRNFANCMKCFMFIRKGKRKTNLVPNYNPCSQSGLYIYIYLAVLLPSVWGQAAWTGISALALGGYMIGPAAFSVPQFPGIVVKMK